MQNSKIELYSSISLILIDRTSCSNVPEWTMPFSLMKNVVSDYFCRMKMAYSYYKAKHSTAVAAKTKRELMKMIFL